jgi:hypothetical protein
MCNLVMYSGVVGERRMCNLVMCNLVLHTAEIELNRAEYA